MIKIKIFRKNSNISGFEVKGHAFHKSEDEQFDLVCAGVSSITQTALLGLLQYLELPLLDQQCRDGYLYCQLPEEIEANQSQKAQAILETMVLGLEAIAETFPKHVKFV